jgi:molybdate transport system substrate-binding protein
MAGSTAGRWALLWLAMAGCGTARSEPVLRVLAAASLAPAAEAVAREFERSTGATVQVVAGASSTLARQAGAGAPGDVFLSADTRWVAWLSARGQLAPCDTADLATNRLVLLSRAGDELAWRPGAPDPGPPPTRLAVGDPEHVPVGRYAKESLESLGAWAPVSERLVATASAPAAVALLASGAADAAIAYATDARGVPGVRVVAELPASSHRPIVYRAGVLVASTHPRAREFLAFLTTAPAQAHLAALGFGPPPARAAP